MELTARLQKMCDKYNMEPEDVAYADMLNAGWGKHEAAYYAYHLAYFDLGKIKVWLKDKLRNTPGINYMVDDLHNEEVAKQRELKELEASLKEKAKKESKKAEKNKQVTADSLRDKAGMLDYLIDLAATPGLDLKTKADLAKQITDLQNYKKEEVKEEDTRINFHIASNCRYCDRCKNCELKDKLESYGCKVVPKSTSPFLWTIEKQDNNADNNQPG